MEQLFVYGLLEDSEVQKKIIGRVIEGIPDVLEGYSESTIKIGDKEYSNIVPDSNSNVDGFIISVTPEELKAIDEYETKAYRREKVVLKSKQEAWVYIS